MRFAWLLAIGAIGDPATGLGQTTTAEEIQITGTRTDSPVDAQSVDIEAIDRRLPATLLQPLSDLLAVQAFSKAGRSFLSVRGGEPNFTVALVKGVRVNDPTSTDRGTFDFEQIAPELVERVSPRICELVEYNSRMCS